jgi:hypothetical protein
MSAATLCDKCGERIGAFNRLNPERRLIKVYVEDGGGIWRDLHLGCAQTLTIGAILRESATREGRTRKRARG